jgi:hypothetical protein
MDWKDEFEMDDDGHLIEKKKHVLPDGGRIHFPYIADHAGRFHSHFADGSIDHTSPHRKGFRFADTDDAARIAANDAYEARSRRMADAWKHKGEPQDGEELPRGGSSRTLSLDAARAAADRAYEARSRRMADAWRHRE